MDDVVIRPRYQRHRVRVKKRKKNYRDTPRFIEKLFVQIVAATLILLIAFALKNIGTPTTDNIINRIRGLLTQNINITTVYERIDSFLSGIKSGILAEDDVKSNPDTILPVADDFVLPDSHAIKNNEINDSEQDAQLSANEANPEFNKTEVMSSEFINLELPLNPPVDGVVVLKYGWMDESISAWESFHYGIDIEVAEETYVKSVMDGSVAETGSKPDLVNYIVIKHSAGYKTIYANCDIISVEPGQFVAEGENIGKINVKGHSHVSHLHFEMWKDGNTVNPMDYIKVH